MIDAAVRPETIPDRRRLPEELGRGVSEPAAVVLVELRRRIDEDVDGRCHLSPESGVVLPRIQTLFLERPFDHLLECASRYIFKRAAIDTGVGGNEQVAHVRPFSASILAAPIACTIRNRT